MKKSNRTYHSNYDTLSIITKYTCKKYTRINVRVMSHTQARNHYLFDKNVPIIRKYTIKVRKPRKNIKTVNLKIKSTGNTGNEAWRMKTKITVMPLKTKNKYNKYSNISTKCKTCRFSKYKKYQYQI